MVPLVASKPNTEASQLKQSFATTIATIARLIPDSPTSDQLTAVTTEIYNVPHKLHRGIR
jgi:hypothetical protein